MQNVREDGGSADDDTSSDFLLAMALQEQFDHELRVDRRTSMGERNGKSISQLVYYASDDEDYCDDRRVGLAQGRSSLGRRRREKVDGSVPGVGRAVNLALFKMAEEGVFTNILNCLSSGKEASIFNAVSPTGKKIVLKIYSSLTTFKGREIFLKYDPRIRAKINIRKVSKFISLWALKEFINLKKIYENGIKCPEPICIRKNILVMSLVGDYGEAAPKLNSVSLTLRQLSRVYDETVNLMESLFHDCHLVHADLSAFNLLYCHGHVYVVDVAQAVLTSHPRALEFLLGDIKNVLSFFVTRGLESVKSDIGGAEERLFKRVTHLDLNGWTGDLADVVCGLDTCRAENRKIF